MKQQRTMMNLCRRREHGNSNEIGDAKQQSAVCSSVDAMAVMYVMAMRWMGGVDLVIGTQIGTPKQLNCLDNNTMWEKATAERGVV